MAHPRLPRLWSSGHRPVVVALLAALLLGLTLARWRDPTAVPDPPADGPRAAELATRLDPNTADAAALSALPGLGEARARAIVDYRSAYAARHAGAPPFHAAHDLLPVKGVGLSTVDNLEPYLTFGPAAGR